MKLLHKISRALSRLPIIGQVFNRYESAWQGWGERSWLFQSLQDARFDIDASTRCELQRRHRYWVSNSQLVQKIRNLFIQFSVGPCGLKPVPNSSDEEWNHTRTHSFSDWSKEPEVSSRTSLSQLTISWAGQLFDDGEFFILKTQDSMGRPAVQTIEAHRVCNDPSAKDYQGMPVVDGIVMDRSGKPKFYAIKTTPVETASVLGGVRASWGYLKASDVIHKFKVRRPGQLRGIPEGFSGMNVLHDFDDLQKLELQCAKIASEIATVETNPSGELDTSMNRRSRLSLQTQNAQGAPTTKNTWADYQVTMGGKRFALRSGDKLENFMVNRPTVVQQEYWDLLVAQICCSYNTPKLLVMPFSLQGTVTRADLDVCASAYRMNFEFVADALRELYEWQGAWANDFDLSQDGATPYDHAQVVIRPPRAPNVDIGYSAKSLETELLLGVKTVQDVYAEKQMDWRVQTRQIAEYLSEVKKLAKEFGIEPGQITKLAVETETPQAEATEPPETDDATEPTTKEPAYA